MSSSSSETKKHELPAPYRGFGTAAVHAGQEPDPHSGAVIPPISLSTTFAQRSPGSKYPGNFEYSRSGNPTRLTFEANVAALENTKYCLAFGSGLATTMSIMHLLKAGDHVVSIDDVYGGTQRYFNNICITNLLVARVTSSAFCSYSQENVRLAANMGLKFSFADFTKDGELEKVITEDTKLVWLETPTNPTLKISDIEKTAEIAHKHNCILVVDNTFMSPFNQQPITLGADIVMHSVTKYINGHSDVVMGVACMNDEDLYTRLKFIQNSIGAVPSPFDSFLACRGLKTLHLRMKASEESASAIAKFLESHDKVEKVIYPGLESHPQHEIAKKQQLGFGGMITFFVKGGLEESKKFLENLKFFALAESLGGVESLAEHPAIMTHASVPAEKRKELGISDSLIRLSVGVEDKEDLLNDVSTALDAI